MWPQTAKGWRERGSDVILVSVDVGNLMIFGAYVSFHASGSNPQDYLAHVPFRSSDQWGACVDYRLATTDATDSLTIDGDTVMGAQFNTPQKYYVCLTWMHFQGGPEFTRPWGSASTADWREESRWWAGGRAQDQSPRRLSHCLQGFCARKSEIIHSPQKYEVYCDNVFNNVFKNSICNRQVFKTLKPGGNMVQLAKNETISQTLTHQERSNAANKQLWE